MLIYTLQRILATIPVMLIVSIIVFLLIHLTPGNPAYLILGEDSTAESIAQLEKQLGLDNHIVVQFFDWFKSVLTGYLGNSIYSSEPVLQIIFNRFGATFSLMVLSILASVVIAVPVAIFIVWKRNKVLDPLFVSVSL